ncbi:hypothetical protein JG688_00016610 [Phytophthora aleatoria]|uniref:Uncharacterized protein n=1 Tax=Phytophthora aleatoria TaxID=2496075 RepID=A0A8J5LYX8_9STRA|nr:hypothetical protein JG688_00016610 [Phytophthora aleatoria]
MLKLDRLRVHKMESAKQHLEDTCCAKVQYVLLLFCHIIHLKSFVKSLEGMSPIRISMSHLSRMSHSIRQIRYHFHSGIRLQGLISFEVCKQTFLFCRHSKIVLDRAL